MDSIARTRSLTLGEESGILSTAVANVGSNLMLTPPVASGQRGGCRLSVSLVETWRVSIFAPRGNVNGLGDFSIRPPSLIRLSLLMLSEESSLTDLCGFESRTGLCGRPPTRRRKCETPYDSRDLYLDKNPFPSVDESFTLARCFRVKPMGRG